MATRDLEIHLDIAINLAEGTLSIENSENLELDIIDLIEEDLKLQSSTYDSIQELEDTLTGLQNLISRMQMKEKAFKRQIEKIKKENAK